MKKITKQTINNPIIVKTKIKKIEINLIKAEDILGFGKIVEIIKQLTAR